MASPISTTFAVDSLSSDDKTALVAALTRGNIAELPDNFKKMDLGDFVNVADAAMAEMNAGGNVFVSTEQTGNGSEQSIAHGKAVVPSFVMAVITETDGYGFDVAEGTHTATYCKLTVTASTKYKVLAFFFTA